MFLEFLEKFCKLTNSEQRIFIFCLKKCPFPRSRTDDLLQIAFSLGLSYKTVWRAFQTFKHYPQFDKLVKYIHSDILPKEHVPDCLNVIAGGLFEVDFFGLELGKVVNSKLYFEVKSDLYTNIPPVEIKVVDNQRFTTENFTVKAGKSGIFRGLSGDGGCNPDPGVRNVIFAPPPENIKNGFENKA